MEKGLSEPVRFQARNAGVVSSLLEKMEHNIAKVVRSHEAEPDPDLHDPQADRHRLKTFSVLAVPIMQPQVI